MKNRSISAGLGGGLLSIVALVLAWNFLTPPDDYENLDPEVLSFTIEAPEMNDPSSTIRVSVDHHVEAQWEYIFFRVTGATDARVSVVSSPGSLSAASEWRCASGLQAASTGAPSTFTALKGGGSSWAAESGFDIMDALKSEGIPTERSVSSSDDGVTCQRVGPIYARGTQGLVLISPAFIRSTLPSHVQASLSESMSLPPNWELFGRNREFSTSESFGSSQPKSGSLYSFESSPERASQRDSSDAIGGLHLARDIVAESNDARLAWISALIGGVGFALIATAIEHGMRRPQMHPARNIESVEETTETRTSARVTSAQLSDRGLALGRLMAELFIRPNTRDRSN